MHGVDAAGQVVMRRQLRRRYVLAFLQKLPPCLVGIEACASSHHWSRELQALGHTVRLLHPCHLAHLPQMVSDSPVSHCGVDIGVNWPRCRATTHSSSHPAWSGCTLHTK